MKEPGQIKTLIVNGITFAKYEIEQTSVGNILFLKVITPMHVTDEAESEDMISRIIVSLEKVEITGISYLNI